MKGRPRKISSASLWEKLVDVQTLKRGWHICRDEVHRDFAEDLLAEQLIAYDLDQVTRELSNRLSTDTYRPESLFNVEIPKGVLGFRPGSILSIKDRIVLCAAVYLLAGAVDHLLPEGVMSFRLKKKISKRHPGQIFREQSIEDLPFLKHKTIAKWIDPFEAWYNAWPQFDEVTRYHFEELGFRYLATSDIAAYFENIQIPILRDFLKGRIEGGDKIINLICHFLEIWALKTSDGRSRFRGIPQGTLVTSFIGNIFLLPLDEAMKKYERRHELKYFRYMDDVRIFAKEYNVARDAILDLTRVLRSLHLNVQTAKTKILDEKNAREISRTFVDKRIDDVNLLIDQLRECEDPSELKGYARQTLANISKSKNNAGLSIASSKTPLDGLDLRLFQRLVTAYQMISSDDCLGLYLREVFRTTDSRVLKKLPGLVKHFPRHSRIANQIEESLSSSTFVFDYQRAECLRAIRYTSRVSSRLNSWARQRLYDSRADRYLRMQAAYLLSRSWRLPGELQKMRKVMHAEQDAHVQSALGMLVIQSAPNSPIVREMVFHENDRIRRLGKHFRLVKNDEITSFKVMESIFGTGSPWWVVCDRMPVIFAISFSENRKILSTLVSYLRKESSRKHVVMDVRETLARILIQAERRLRYL